MSTTHCSSSELPDLNGHIPNDKCVVLIAGW